MNTETSVHGHDILKMVHAAKTPFTRESLAAEAALRFGPAARYHTCSAAEMSLSELLDFLLTRGKLFEREGRVFADISQMCSHGEGDHNH